MADKKLFKVVYQRRDVCDHLVPANTVEEALDVSEKTKDDVIGDAYFISRIMSGTGQVSSWTLAEVAEVPESFRCAQHPEYVGQHPMPLLSFICPDCRCVRVLRTRIAETPA